MVVCAHLRQRADSGSAGPLVLGDSRERVSRMSFREGASGRAGWSGKAAGRAVLAWALPGGLQMRAGGMNHGNGSS